MEKKVIKMPSLDSGFAGLIKDAAVGQYIFSDMMIVSEEKKRIFGHEVAPEKSNFLKQVNVFKLEPSAGGSSLYRLEIGEGHFVVLLFEKKDHDLSSDIIQITKFFGDGHANNYSLGSYKLEDGQFYGRIGILNVTPTDLIKTGANPFIPDTFQDAEFVSSHYAEFSNMYIIDAENYNVYATFLPVCVQATEVTEQFKADHIGATELIVEPMCKSFAQLIDKYR